VEEVIDEDTGQLSPLVARRKKFLLYPMTEEEAIVQMRNLGHDNFFLFYNAETNKINVLYRRRNGSYGLIEPELG
jgi:putative sigma-54 modulation protein